MQIYCKSDNKYHYKNELPTTLKPFFNYRFSSGPITGEDFNSFNTKYKNVIKKLLPIGYTIHSWKGGHYESSGVISTPDNKYIYIGFSDVRFFPNEWISNILIRTMNSPKDWTGGINHSTSLFTFTEDIRKIYR